MARGEIYQIIVVEDSTIGEIKLHQVLYVPFVKQNSSSLRQLFNARYVIVFLNNFCYILDKEYQKLVIDIEN